MRTDRGRTNNRRIRDAYGKVRKQQKYLYDRSHIIIATFVQIFFFQKLTHVSSAHTGKFYNVYAKLTSVLLKNAGKFLDKKKKN